jgi:hypothetical protein
LVGSHNLGKIVRECFRHQFEVLKSRLTLGEFGSFPLEAFDRRLGRRSLRPRNADLIRDPDREGRQIAPEMNGVTQEFSAGRFAGRSVEFAKEPSLAFFHPRSQLLVPQMEIVFSLFEKLILSAVEFAHELDEFGGLLRAQPQRETSLRIVE